MELTELLTNPLVWGLLAWLFSRFFTSKNKEEETGKKQPNKRENLPKSRPNSRPIPKPVMTTVDQKPRKEARPGLQTVQQAYENMKNQAAEQIEHTMVVNEQQKKTRIVHKEQFPKVNRNIKQNNLKVDQQKAVQGVIWSEILGAPRSKNPHYTRNRRHS